MGVHRVEVSPVPPWIEHARWLGEADWRVEQGPPTPVARAQLDTEAAADLSARLRGTWLAGQPVAVSCSPPLKRAPVRAARTHDARRRRETTPGFDDPRCRAEGLARIYLTPHALAMHMAARAAREFPGGRVIDAMCGAGGNAIAFARAGLEVVAVDNDPQNLALARHNAGIVGVGHRCSFVLDDGAEVLAREAYDLAFIDPPWSTEPLSAPKDPGVEHLGPLVAMLDAATTHPAWIKVPAGTRLEGPLAPGPQMEVEAVFGDAPGDWRRIKFLWVRRGGAPARPAG